MDHQPEIVIQLTTTDDPELLKTQIQELVDKFDVDCGLEAKHFRQRSADAITITGVVLTTMAFGTALLPFLTQLLKLRGPDLKTDGGTTIKKSNITINNVTININRESIKTLQENHKSQVPPELLQMLETNLQASDSSDESDLD